MADRYLDLADADVVCPPPVKVGVGSFSTALFGGNVIVPSAG